MAKKIVIGSDHGGFELKNRIKDLLGKKGYIFEDVGTVSGEACDYPQFGYDVASLVSRKKAAKGILICKTGTGMAVIANKLPGVRAGVCWSVADAISARQHNDTNVLVLAATKTSPQLAVKIAAKWLETDALKGRHARRVKQIKDLEKKVFKKIKK